MDAKLKDLLDKLYIYPSKYDEFSDILISILNELNNKIDILEDKINPFVITGEED
ncbi:MAG: hypothetical protein AABY22_20685 [Nanoarchaeota archaeon]